jgi:hypothetical protein
MSIAVYWENPEHTIIRWDFEDQWSWEEFADSARVSNAMIASADHAVIVIMNADKSRAPFGNITSYQRSAFNYSPDNVRALVLVCSQTENAAQAVTKVFQPVQVVPNLSAARAMFIQQSA